MNIFFVINGELITPMLSGSILPGITRDTVITLAKQWDIKVAERKISIDEVLDAHTTGKLEEIFGSGTALMRCWMPIPRENSKKFSDPEPQRLSLLSEKSNTATL